MVLGVNNNPKAPNFEFRVNSYKFSTDVSKLLGSGITFSNTDGLADHLKIKALNEGFTVVDKKFLAVGNELELWAGSGNELTFIGAAVIEKSEPTWPSSGPSTIEIDAFGRDREMMKNSPRPSEESEPFRTEAQQQAAKRRKKGSVRNGRVWPDGTPYSDVARARAIDYGFDPDIDPTPSATAFKGMFQPTAMTDYQLISGLANETGFLFWVDRTEAGRWVLHFKDPDTTEIQDKKFKFIYRQGDNTSLIDFTGTQELGNSNTELTIHYTNPKTGKTEKLTVDGTGATTSSQFVGDLLEDQPGAGSPQDLIISFGGAAVKVVSDRTFDSLAQVRIWGENWYRANNENFFKGRGHLRGEGIETLRARQVHSIAGVSSLFDGEYYFSDVTHQISASAGYTVEFSGRKIVNLGI